MVQTQVGSTLTLGAVKQSLFLLFGQYYQQVHIPHQLRRQQLLSRWKRPQSVHMAWDGDGTDIYEIEESYFQIGWHPLSQNFLLVPDQLVFPPMHWRRIPQMWPGITTRCHCWFPPLHYLERG